MGCDLPQERGFGMANKITKRKVIAMMLNEEVIKSNAVYVEFLTHYDEQLANRKVSKANEEKQKADANLKEIILSCLGQVEKATVSEIQLMHESLSPVILSNQKVTALMGKLIAEGLVKKIPDKKKSYFCLA